MRPRGFTLIELLVAIVILSIAVMIVFESLVSVTNTTDIAREEAARLRERQYLWRSFSENFSAIYSDPSCTMSEFALQGDDGTGPGGPGDSISFCTSLPMSGSSALPAVLRGVTYEIVSGDEAGTDTPTAGFSGDAGSNRGDAAAYLLITERPVVHQSGSDGVSVDDSIDESDVRSHQVPINSMDIRYYDADQQDWVDDWDSIEKQRLPWAIEVMINLARNPDDDAASGANPEEPDLDMTFVLPLGAGTKEQFFDPNHLSNDSETTDPNSIFNKDSGGKGKGTGKGKGFNL